MNSQNIVNGGTINAVNCVLSGDLTVSGTTMTVDAENLLVKDKNVVLGVGSVLPRNMGLYLEDSAT